MQHRFQVVAADKVVVQTLAGDGELHCSNHLRAYFEGDLAGTGDKHPVSLGREVERNILIGLFTAGAAVLIPDIHHLPVFHKGCEALAKAVDGLPHTEVQVLNLIRLLIMNDGMSAKQADRGGQDLAFVGELDIPRTRGRHVCREILGTGCKAVLVRFNSQQFCLALCQLEERPPFRRSLEVIRAYVQYIGKHGGDLCCDHCCIEGGTAVLDFLGGGKHGELSLSLLHIDDGNLRQVTNALVYVPIAVSEFHSLSPVMFSPHRQPFP